LIFTEHIAAVSDEATIERTEKRVSMRCCRDGTEQDNDVVDEEDGQLIIVYLRFQKKWLSVMADYF
jgi:hypothetical protein